MPNGLSGIRVLIVDDNATSREILCNLTSSWGMRPGRAEGGAWALEVLSSAVGEADPFEIAVIDMQMPEMNGEELGLAIKADPRLAGMPMILLISLGDRRDWERTGFAGCATKPIRRDDLHAVLAGVLSGEPGAVLKAVKKQDAIQDTLQPFTGLSPRILLAEDNFVNQQVAIGILKKYGLAADIAANGVEAIKALEAIPYALVLMDMRMPLMDGVEATRLIRNPTSSVLNHDVPIIAMTANAMQSDQDLCKTAGMNDFVPKPVQPSVLINAIQRWLVAENKEGTSESAVVSAP